MSVFHSRTLNFPIILSYFHPVPFLYSKGSDKYIFICLHLQLGLSSTYGLLLTHPFFYCGLHVPLLVDWFSPLSPKSSPHAHPSPPLIMTQGQGVCHSPGLMAFLCDSGAFSYRIQWIQASALSPDNLPQTCYYYIFILNDSSKL